jgi:DNA polymerase
MGLDRFSDDPARGVYIANIVKCRPPRNRNPEKGEVDACLPYLRRQIELVKPEAIVLLGAVPLEHLMGITGITRHRGQWLSYANIPVMPTFHPALILRFSASPQMEREKKLMVWDDLKKVMALLNLPVPAPKQH